MQTKVVPCSVRQVTTIVKYITERKIDEKLKFFYDRSNDKSTSKLADDTEYLNSLHVAKTELISQTVTADCDGRRTKRD